MTLKMNIPAAANSLAGVAPNIGTPQYASRRGPARP